MATLSPWEWEKQDVKEWAATLFGEQLATAFEDNDVTGHLLLTQVDEEVLRENIIVESWGMRKRILSAINELLQAHPADNTSNSAPRFLTRSSVPIARNKPLTLDEIRNALDQHITNDVIPKWENEKKPLLERSAYRLWMKRRKDARFIKDSELALVHILKHRIPRICEALAQSGATQVAELLRVSASLDVACCDARRLMWQANLLRGPKPPTPDPSIIYPMKKTKLARKAIEISSDESLSSEQAWSSMVSDDETIADQFDSDWSDFIVEDDPMSDDEEGIEYHSEEDSYSDSSFQEEENNGDDDDDDVDDDDLDEEEESEGSSESESWSLTQRRKRQIKSSESDEAETVTLQSTSKEVPELSGEAEQHTLNPRSKRHPSGKEPTSVPKKRRRLQSEEQIECDTSGQDPQTKANEKRLDVSISSLSDGPISEEDEIEKTNSKVPGEDRKQKAVYNVNKVEDYFLKRRLKKHILSQKFPHLTNTFSKMSNLSILELYLSLDMVTPDDLTSDEQELLEELKSLFSQLSDDKGIAEMAKDEEQKLVLLGGLQIVRDILHNRVLRKKSTNVRKKANGPVMKRRVLSSDDGNDIDDEYTNCEDSTEAESSTTDTRLVVKKGFRKIRDDSETVSSMRKRHQQMWKEYEARAEIELRQLQTSEDGVIINIGDVEKAKRVSVSPHLARHLKAHQIDGIRFLWRQTMMLQTGGVLGHAMGLGKTFQVITYLHTIFREIANDNPDLPEKVKPGRFLILAPATTLKNWENEFKAWIPQSEQPIMRQIINYSTYKSANGFSRERILKTWYKRGGVLIMGYDMFRHAIRNMDSSSYPIRKWLINPGPSIVIIDEGHKIKSNKSQLSSVVKMFDTKFRICMTGYPLQNNLEEYYCMIDFIYPGYLGTLSEFRNAYKNPIENFYEDISPAERFISRRQLYKLRRTLADLIHRRDTTVLQAELKPKTEFDIFCKLTVEQHETYKRCLDDARKGSKLASLQAVQVLRNICNHPAAFFEQLLNRQMSDDLTQGRKKSNPYSTAETSTPSSTTSYLSAPEGRKHVVTNQTGRRETSNLPSTMSGSDTSHISPVLPGTDIVASIEKIFDDEEVDIPKEVASAFRTTREYLQSLSDLESIELSCKCAIMMELVKESLKVDDKLIIFSHSLPTLNYIGKLMKKEKINTLRIDGSTPVVLRQEIIDNFNNQEKWRIVLVSSKAASIGINLISANRVILLDLDWNPCHDEQAVARAYRFGQKKEVFVYRLQTYDTIEQSIFRINVHKSGISSRVVDDKTLQPQNQDVMKAFHMLPAVSPTEPLRASAYTSIDDSVLRTVAEVCKDKLTDIQLHTTYTTEYLHEELNEKQKEEIEKQLTLEQRIINGEVAEEVTTVPNIVGRTDISERLNATQSPLTPHPQLRASILPGDPQPSYNHSAHHTSPINSTPLSSIRSIEQPYHTTQLPSRSLTLPPPSTPFRAYNRFRAYTRHQHAIFIPSATVPTAWKQPLPQTFNRSLNSSEQPYRENNNAYLRNTSDSSPNRQYPSNTSSNIPYTFREQNNISHPNNHAHYRKDTTMHTAEHLRQELQNFRVHLNDYENKFKAPSETSSGNGPNNSSSQ